MDLTRLKYEFVCKFTNKILFDFIFLAWQSHINNQKTTSHYANTYQMSACDMFVDVPLTKEHRMTKSRDTVEGKYISE